MSLLNKLQEIEKNFEELESRMGDSDIASNPKEMQQLARKHSKMSPIVDAVVEYKTLLKESLDTKEIIASEEPEMVELAKEELLILENKIAELEKQIQILLIPEDANDEKNVIIEIRAGAGGDEAALFAAVLFRMYVRFAERQNWKTEVISQNETEIGGVKEIIFSVYGVGAYSMLKFESGVHRVQRVPETESSGRVHTSTATVAVLPEAEDVDIDIRAEDLKIDTYRASGAGGQHVNMTDSAVRITHVPSGIVCTCQDERSQIKNRAKAIQLLRTKLYDAELQKQNDKMAAERKGQVGSGDRSERIRTYNYPQNRLSDHRINLTLHKLEQILDGDMYELITLLSEADQAKKLSALSL